MLNPDELTDDFLAAARRINATETDVVGYSGDLFSPHDFRFMAEVVGQRRSENVLLVLTTYGGAADAAYRIARSLQRSYRRVRVLVVTECKSAGSLIVLGAHELVMTAMAELGPLDVQLRKPDAIGERVSGLTPVEALTALRVEAFDTFEYHFLEIQQRSGGQITSQTAASIAAQMCIGHLRPIYAKLNPMMLGEYQRAMTVASEYGARLAVGNALSDTLSRMLYGYPSHGFVIDFEEAGELFETVREPLPDELDLIMQLIERGLVTPDGRRPVAGRGQPQAFAPVFGFVAEPVELQDVAEEPEQEDATHPPSGPPTTAGGHAVAERSKPKPTAVLPGGDRKAGKRPANKPHEADGGTGAPGE